MQVVLIDGPNKGKELDASSISDVMPPVGYGCQVCSGRFIPEGCYSTTVVGGVRRFTRGGYTEFMHASHVREV